MLYRNVVWDIGYNMYINVVYNICLLYVYDIHKF